MPRAKSNKVFIVHGHDEGARHSVCGFLTRLGFDPIVLRDRPNVGRNILTKFKQESKDVGFAVVLLTPDDIGGKVGDPTGPRARQNVIFEFGYFVGVLGAARVAALMKGGMEQPSDLQGVIYVPMDEHGDWRLALARELESVGYQIDFANPAFYEPMPQSYALSLAQSRALIEVINWGTYFVIRDAVNNVGHDGVASITFGQVKKHTETKTWSQFSRGHMAGLSRVLKRLTNDPKPVLIWTIDEEWDGESDDGGKLYIDGRAVVTLKEACRTYDRHRDPRP